MSGAGSAPTWRGIAKAAVVLGVTESALRRRLERHAARGEDGVVTARIDGVLARKWGRHWRVLLGDWDPARQSSVVVSRPHSASGRPGGIPL